MAITKEVALKAVEEVKDYATREYDLYCELSDQVKTIKSYILSMPDEPSDEFIRGEQCGAWTITQIIKRAQFRLRTLRDAREEESDYQGAYHFQSMVDALDDILNEIETEKSEDEKS